MPPNVNLQTLPSLASGMVRSHPALLAKSEVGKGQVQANRIREALGLGVVGTHMVKAALENGCVPTWCGPSQHGSARVP